MDIRDHAAAMLTHSQILSQGTIDNYRNYMGEVVDNSFVFVYAKTRDSDILTLSNYDEFIFALKEDDIYILSNNHWLCGWVENIYVKKDTESHLKAAEMLCRLENYPVLNEEKFSEMEQDEAQEIWEKCYSIPERINYIKKYKSQFDFSDYSALISCVRGKCFYGYASELIN